VRRRRQTTTCSRAETERARASASVSVPASENRATRPSPVTGSSSPIGGLCTGLRERLSAAHIRSREAPVPRSGCRAGCEWTELEAAIRKFPARSGVDTISMQEVTTLRVGSVIHTATTRIRRPGEDRSGSPEASLHLLHHKERRMGEGTRHMSIRMGEDRPATARAGLHRIALATAIAAASRASRSWPKALSARRSRNGHRTAPPPSAWRSSSARQVRRILAVLHNERPRNDLRCSSKTAKTRLGRSVHGRPRYERGVPAITTTSAQLLVPGVAAPARRVKRSFGEQVPMQVTAVPVRHHGRCGYR